MKKITLFLLLVAFAGMANATVYYVSSTATGNGTGTSWANAFLSPAAAIASATPQAGDEFWVKQGTYVSATQLTWETGQHFYGGFVGNETSRSQRSTDATLTILEGNNTNKVLNAPSMASPTTWDGFTIQKGFATGGGAGAFLQKNAILSNCIIKDNATSDFGGAGIFIQGLTTDTDSIKVINCTIKNNISTKSGAAKRGGGGIYVKAGSYKAVIRGCVIENNIVDGLANSNSDIDGGGVYLCDGILEGSIIRNNTATNKNATTQALSLNGKCQGGGVFIMPQTTSNPITVRNCTITGNVANTSQGGGIAIDPLWGATTLIAAPVNITKTIISNNWAYKNGGGIMTEGLNPSSTANYTFANCVIANNESSTVAAGGGGAFINNVALYTGTVSFTNCTVVNNKMLTTNFGGAGIFYNNIKSDITNCVFWGNGSVGALSPYHVRVNTTLTTNKMIKCVFDNRFVESQVSPTNFATDLTGKVIVDVANTGSAGGTLYANFVSPTNFVGKVVLGADQTSLNAANWSITHASACVNNGATIAGITTDIAGLARPQAGDYDIGAYELRAYTITATANNGTMGSVSGAGSKVTGSTATLVATANSGYHFVNWTESGSEVSTNATYSFTASANRTLVANFEPNTVALSSGITNAADITCTTCDVTVASGAELTVGATKALKSVTVAAGGKLTITAGNLNVTNGITLESTSDATATLVDAYETPTANATVKQYVTAGRNWYMSAPLNNTANVSDLNKGFSVQQYNEATGLWELASGTLTRGRGYIQVANASQGTSGTVQFEGIVNSGDVSVSLTNNTAGRGFNLVGNPYPSYLNWSLVATDLVNTHPTTGAKMPNGTAWYRTIDYNGKSAWATGVVYAANSVVYNGTSFYKTLTGGTSGATAPTGTGSNISDGSVIWQNEGSVYVFATVSSNGTPSHTSVSNLIPPMQAFWVKTNTGGGTLTFKNSMRAHESVSNKLKAPKREANSMPLVRLSVTNGASADQVAIYASENASNDFDSADAPKFFNNSGSYQAEIYTLAANEKLAINALNSIEEGTTLALGFVTEKDNRFSLKATEIANLPANLQLILRDKQTNTEFNLSEGEAYEFGSSATNNADRLSLIFRAKGTTTGFDNKNQSKAIVYTNAAGQIVISAPEKCNYSIYNALGQLIENGVLKSELQTVNCKLQTGIFVVKVNNQSTRVIIK
jgi:hypothetical protein